MRQWVGPGIGCEGCLGGRHVYGRTDKVHDQVYSLIDTLRFDVPGPV